jgi:hypothetical protein
MKFAVLLIWFLTLLGPPLVITHWAMKRRNSRLVACIVGAISAPIACGFLFLAIAESTNDLEFAFGVLGRYIFPSALAIGLVLSLIVSFLVHPRVT